MASKPSFLIVLSNNSIGHLVFLMFNSSLTHPSSSFRALNIRSYNLVGSRWKKGRCERKRLRHICWCPPKGICQAGKDMKITPPRVFNNCLHLCINSSLSSICSITSWQTIRSNWCLSSFNRNTSEAMKRPFAPFSWKKLPCVPYPSLCHIHAHYIAAHAWERQEVSTVPAAYLQHFRAFPYLPVPLDVRNEILLACGCEFVEILSSVKLSWLHLILGVLWFQRQR